MIYARFNGTDYKLEQRPVLTFSASETTFSEIVIDFTGKTAADLPIKYQEIQIVDTGTPDVILYYGYCSEPRLPAFNGTQERVLLTIELMSPQTYLTKRTVSLLVQNDNIHDAVEDILAGVVAHDGFTIQLNDLPSTEYLSEFISNRTVESILSNLAGRFGFIWYVDELKRIFIKNLDNIESSAVSYSLTSPTATDLESVQPFFNVSDYANKLNFTNVTLISGQELLSNGVELRDGESYQFAFPFSIGESVIYRLLQVPALAFYLATDDPAQYEVVVDVSLKTITYDSAIGFSGVDDADITKKILLERDAENPNLITGLKWSGATAYVDTCGSYTALRPTTMTYIDPYEISLNAGKLNTSGIVEKEVDVYGKYYTYDELTSYARTLFRQNNKQADTVELVFNGDDLSSIRALLVPTSKVFIDLPNQFITASNYVVTSGEFVIGQGKQRLTVNVRRSNLSENYVDIFRKESGETDENLSQFITYYSQDENIILGHKILVDGEEVDV